MTDQIKKLNPKFLGRDEEICETINALIDHIEALEKRVEGLEMVAKAHTETFLELLRLLGIDIKKEQP